jgi:uncharacterized protein (DUF924 family)/pimeloyl-ACP methyl ester carboxylesterase
MENLADPPPPATRSGTYLARLESRSEFQPVGRVRYHVRLWGEADAPKLFLLHGWMDVSASFQFLVDALAQSWHVIAPDWRGFGLSGWAPGGYWFPDYYADLDALLDLYAPGEAVNLVGHSMGGNVACTYAGIRPQRVKRLVSLEGFGSWRSSPGEAPARYAKWLDELSDPLTFAPYPSFDAVAARLRKNNPRLAEDKANFLARHWAREEAPGRVVLVSDPKHKTVNPVLNRIEEVLACWRCYEGPVLWVAGADSNAPGWRADTPEQLAERKSAFRQFRDVTLADCGHMVHHDQPEKVAGLLEEFLRPAGIPREAEEVLAFWFGAPGAPEHGQPRDVWFRKSEAFDAQIRERFFVLHERAARGELDAWKSDARSTLALIVLLDQFPRNLFRESAHAFATDARALALARGLVARGADHKLAPVERWFAYLPFVHAEERGAQDEALRLFAGLMHETGLSAPLQWAQKHYDVIARYGRFPHRNALLGRTSTADEIEFLKQPGSRF